MIQFDRLISGKEFLAPYKAPKAVEFLAAQPRTGLGKIDSGKLEAMNWTKSSPRLAKTVRQNYLFIAFLLSQSSMEPR